MAGAFNLGVGGVGGAVVGDSGAEDGDVGLGESLHGSVAHLESGSHIHDVEVRQFPRAESRRSEDQRHFCSAQGCFFGQGYAHLACGVVADETHRVEFFLRRPRRDEHVLTGHGLLRHQTFRSEENLFGFEHPSRAGSAAGQETLGAGQDGHVRKRAKRPEVVLEGRMSIHLVVHRGGDEDRALHGEESRCESIVGNAVGHLADDISCGRRYNHQVSPIGQRDMLGRVVVGRGKHVGIDLVAGERLKSEVGDELQRISRSRHLHFRSRFAQESNQEGRLVRGYSAADAHYYVLARKHLLLVLEGCVARAVLVHELVLDKFLCSDEAGFGQTLVALGDLNLLFVLEGLFDAVLGNREILQFGVEFFLERSADLVGALTQNNHCFVHIAHFFCQHVYVTRYRVVRGSCFLVIHLYNLRFNDLRFIF